MREILGFRESRKMRESFQMRKENFQIGWSGQVFLFLFFEKLWIQILVFFLNFSGGANMEVGMMLRILSWRHGVAIWAQKI